MIPLVTATIPYESLESGKTRPTIIESVDEAGEIHEVVVKVFLEGERGKKAAISEIVCSGLSRLLGLKGPSPYLVQIPPGFAELVDDPVARERLKGATGLQFGSAYLRGLPTVSANRPIPPEKRHEAGGIFVFDYLTQNPDRRIDKPNLLEADIGYWLIDHDLALSFVGEIIIGGSIAPWDIRALSSLSYSFLTRHLFFEGLKGRGAVLDEFSEAFAKIRLADQEYIFSQVPAEWWPNKDFADSMRDYINSAVEYGPQIVTFAKTFLDR